MHKGTVTYDLKCGTSKLAFGTVVLNHIENPFDPLGTKKSKTDIHGGTLDKYLPGFCLGQKYAVKVNKEILAVDYDYTSYVVKPNDIITFTPLQQGGGGGGGKQIVMIVAMVALTIASGGMAAGLMGATAGMWGAAAAGIYGGLSGALILGGLQVGIMIAGGMLINAMLAPSSSSANLAASSPELQSSTYSWTGIQTNRDINKPIPVLYGTHALGGTVINNRFSYQGNDDWVSMQIALCHGEIEAIRPQHIKVNDSNYSSFITSNANTINYDYRSGGFDQSIMSGFDDSIYNNGAVTRKIIYNQPYSFDSTSTNMDYFRLHFEFPRGCYLMDTTTGAKYSKTVQCQAQYRKKGDATWKALSVYTPIYGTEYFHYYTKEIPSTELFGTPIEVQYELWSPSSTSITIDKYTHTRVAPGKTRRVLLGYGLDPTITFTLSTTVSYKQSFKPVDTNNVGIVLNPGQYEFKVTRITPESPDSSYDVSDLHVRFLEEIQTADVNYGGLALLGLNIKATDQLSNNRPNIVTTVTRKPLLINSEYRDSSNPAWICLDILTNKNYGMGLALSKVNFTEFNRWAEFCDGGIGEYFNIVNSIPVTSSINVRGNKLIIPASYLPQNEQLILNRINLNNSTLNATSITSRVLGLQDIISIEQVYITGDIELPKGFYYNVIFNEDLLVGSSLEYSLYSYKATFAETPKLKFNGVFDTTGDIWNTLQEVAKVGRGQIILQGSTYSTIFDEPKLVTGLYNAANSTNVVVKYIGRADISSEIEIQYTDASIEYEMNSISVQDSDVMLTNTQSKRSTVQIKGITTEPEALVMGKYLLASSKYLRRIVTLDADIEAITQTVGDVIAVQTDVTQYGIGGLIVARYGNLVKLDSVVTLEKGIVYNLKFKNHETDTIMNYNFTADNVDPVNYYIDAFGTTVVGELVIDDFKLLVFSNENNFLETNILYVPNTYNLNTNDRYTFGIDNSDSILCTITDISREGDLTRKITAIEYNETILDFDYDTDILQRVSPATQVKNKITNLKVNDTLIKNSRGDVIISLATSWDGLKASKYNVYYTTSTSDYKYYVGNNISSTYFSWDTSVINSGDIITIVVEDIYDTTIHSSVLYTVVGFLALPPDVDVFTVSGAPNETKTLVYDIINKPLDLAGYIIKYQVGDALDWFTATPIHQGVLTASPYKADITKVQGQYTLLIKAVDTMGNESANVKFIKFNQGETLIDNLIYEKDFHAEGFLGEIYGGTVQPNNDLLADNSADLFYWQANGDIFYKYNDAQQMYQGTYASMYFIGEFTPDGTGTALIEYTGSGSVLLEYREMFQNHMYTNNDYFMYGLSTQNMYTESPWTAYTGGFQVKPFFKYEIRASYIGGTVRPNISKLRVVVDVADIDESYEDVAISSLGTIVYTKYINNLKNVVATLQTSIGSTASRVEVVSKSQTSALIKCFDINNNPVNGLVDIRLKGYINE